MAARRTCSMASSLVMLTSTSSASRALMVRLSQRGAALVIPVFSPTASLIACTSPDEGARSQHI